MNDLKRNAVLLVKGKKMRITTGKYSRENKKTTRRNEDAFGER